MFSIVENKDQSLAVLLKGQQNFEEGPDPKSIPIRTHKLSIHVSPMSPGTTIARTMELEDGRTIRSAQFIKDSKADLFCLVFGALCGDLSGARYNALPRSKDIVVQIGKFDAEDMATLIFHIVAADHDRTMPFVHGHSLTMVEFKRWNIGVYSTYLNMPLPIFGRMSIPLTRPEKIDGVVVPMEMPEKLAREGAKSVSVDELRKILHESNNQLAAGSVTRHCSVVPEEMHSTMNNHKFVFHPSAGSLAAERDGWPQVGTSL